MSNENETHLRHQQSEGRTICCIAEFSDRRAVYQIQRKVKCVRTPVLGILYILNKEMGFGITIKVSG